MKNYDFADTLAYEKSPAKGFSKAQLLEFSTKDIEELLLWEYPQSLGGGEENPNKSQPNEKEPNEGGPRPPKEDEYPDEEKEELLSEVSDPEKKD